MPVRNQNWYNLQSTRRYPLDDKSTGVDDAGAFIREDILVDCHIRFPNTLGAYLYVQGITVSENLVTILFGAATSLTSESNPTIAVISITKPAATNTHYNITSLTAGVNGWVVLGAGINTNFVGRYTTAEQTYIGLRNARPYQPLPIPTLGKINLSTALSGLVKLTAISPVTTEYIDETALPEEQRMPKYDPITQATDYAPIRAIRFSTEAPSIVFNPLTYFLGPCGQRPESGTCPKKPIERINGVQPDCENGNINIVADNGLSVRMFAECGGADITTDLGLSEACQEPPRNQDRGEDKCPCESPYDKTDSWCWPPFDPNRDVVCEEDKPPCPDLPICTSFSPCTESLFETMTGSFILEASDAPGVCCPSDSGAGEHDVYAATSRGTANISLYRGCASDWAFNHTVSVEVKPTGNGARRNGGLVTNYMKVTEAGRCRTKYIAVIVDETLNELQIHRYTGTVLVKEAAIAFAPPEPPENFFELSTFDPSRWYKISVTAAVASETATTITAALYEAGGGLGAPIAVISTTVEDYEAVDGRAGLFTNGSTALFNKFEVV